MLTTLAQGTDWESKNTFIRKASIDLSLNDQRLWHRNPLDIVFWKPNKKKVCCLAHYAKDFRIMLLKEKNKQKNQKNKKPTNETKKHIEKRNKKWIWGKHSPIF